MAEILRNSFVIGTLHKVMQHNYKTVLMQARFALTNHTAWAVCPLFAHQRPSNRNAKSVTFLFCFTTFILQHLTTVTRCHCHASFHRSNYRLSFTFLPRSIESLPQKSGKHSTHPSACTPNPPSSSRFSRPPRSSSPPLLRDVS